MTERIVRFSTDITAADAERRIIVGTVVPYGQIGDTSMGPVTFAAGSVSAGDMVKLVLEHDMKRPIGRATGFVDGPERLVGTFRLSHTTAASDALVEASDGLRDGLSVGARISEYTVNDQGVMVVTAADLVEVSLVHTPAFSDAVVSQVAASAPEEDDTPDESEEDIVPEETTEVAAAEVAASVPSVEAARPSQPYITAQPRDLKGLTAGGLLRAQLRSKMFDDQDSSDLVRAAFAGQTTTTDQGMVPIPLLREIISTIDDQRPFINSIDRQPLPPSGMSFRIPSVTVGVTVAEQATQNTDVDSTEGDIDDITVNVKTFAGGNRVSRQLIDRSDPSYFDELLRQLAASYANVTDKFAHDTAATNAVTSAGAAGSGIYGAVVQGIADAYGVMRFTPNTLHMPAQTSLTNRFGWLNVLREVDADKRPLFSAANPSNAAGVVTQGSTNGTVAGLNAVVNPNISGDLAFGYVYPSAFATFYETAGSPIQVSIDNPEKLSVEVSVFGYVALALKHPSAMRGLSVTPE
jgi:HK97 family phage prohead protease/HK97 family phage major capsid protein